MTLDKAMEMWEAQKMWEEQNEGRSSIPLKAMGSGYGGNTYSQTRLGAILHPAIVPDNMIERVENIKLVMESDLPAEEKDVLIRHYQQSK